MKLESLMGLLGLAAFSAGARVARDYDNNDYYVLHLDEATNPAHIADRLGFEHQGHLGELEDHHIFRAPKAELDVAKTEIKERKRRRRSLGGADVLDGVLLATKQEARTHLEKRVIPPPPAGFIGARSPQKPKADSAAVQRQSEIMRELQINDPIFDEQWHLFNPVQLGHDVNVSGLWLEGVTGMNSTVAIVDDGLDMHSNDLKDNYFAEGSYDFNDHDEEPKPELSDDRHGTRCAGEVAAGRNAYCGVGVAYDSKVAGIRMLSKAISSADEAEALMYKIQDNQIYSCSWGPPDNGQTMEAPDTLIKRAMLKSIQKGRGGLGSIYVFASGNGDLNGDNCNFDGYTNSIYSITVGAVDREGKHPYYSEHCSAHLVVTYSSGSGDAIHTTDVGEDSCYSNHGGTSAAAPLAAGIFALVLQVRPDLSWRDLQYLVMETAKHIDNPDVEWQTTAIGKKFSHTFAYGKIDSYALVEKARDWDLVKPQAWYFSPWLHINKDIPEGTKGLTTSFEVTEDMLKEANLERVEHVTVTMNVEHARRGDLSVDLISPEKVVSHIAVARPNDGAKSGFDDWTFMSVAHWGESGVGEWTVIIKDENLNSETGSFTDWRLKLWGESIHADQATLLPMPNDDDDADHDVVSTLTAPVATTSVMVAPIAGKPSATMTQPADHPHRPTKPAAKPTGTTDEEDATSTDEAATPTETTSSSWVSWLPTFGASKKAQIWIYGAIGLIVVFCIGLGIYLYTARRRRIRNDPRNTYEFELLDDEEIEGLNSGEKNNAGGRRNRRTRGGELYDAFAGGSDDESLEDEYRDMQTGTSSRRLPGDEEEQYIVGGDSDDDSIEEKDASRPRS